MNNQTKFLIELISLKKEYEKKLRDTKQMRFVYKIEAIKKTIEI